LRQDLSADKGLIAAVNGSIGESFSSGRRVRDRVTRVRLARASNRIAEMRIICSSVIVRCNNPAFFPDPLISFIPLGIRRAPQKCGIRAQAAPAIRQSSDLE